MGSYTAPTQILNSPPGEIKAGRHVHRLQHSLMSQLFSELLCLTSCEEIKGNKKYQCYQTQLR